MNGRRSTMSAGPLSDATNFQNARLSMVPGKQVTSRSRKSMAPGLSVSGLSDSLAHVSIGGNGSSSSMGNKRVSEGRKSLAPGAMAGNRQSTTGRSSMYGRSSSMAAQGQAAHTKEPRPIREKAWQTNSIKSLIGFLVESGYSQSAVSFKSLQAPSFKDFQLIFKFLYGILDPLYEFKENSKFEDHVQSILKSLKYPFADSITKSVLYSAGSMHAWPTLLACLMWMIELILCCDQLEAQGDLDNKDLDDVQLSEKIFFEYLKKSYFSFLDTGDQANPDMDQELIRMFNDKNAMVIKGIEKYKKDIETLEREWEALTGSDSPLVRTENEKARVESEREQLKDSIAVQESEQQKLHDSILALSADLEILETDCATLQEEKVQLQAVVNAQLISPADVDRMNSERDQLIKSLEVVGVKIGELNKDIWDKEINIQKKMDELEKMVQEYNTRAYKLGILGSKLPEMAPLKNELEIHVHAANHQKMVPMDLKNTVKLALLNLKTKFNNQFHGYQDELIALQEAVDSVNWALTRKEEELKGLNTRIKGLSDRYKEEKEHIGLTLSATAEEIENYERQIQRLKIEANNLLLASQQKAQKTAVEYDKLSRQYTEQKEKLLNQVVSGLVEVFNFHQHVTTTLEELQKEWEDQNQCLALQQ